LQKWNSKAETESRGNARKTFLPQPQFGVLIFSLCGPASKNAADGILFLFWFLFGENTKLHWGKIELSGNYLGVIFSSKYLVGNTTFYINFR